MQLQLTQLSTQLSEISRRFFEAQVFGVSLASAGLAVLLALAVYVVLRLLLRQGIRRLTADGEGNSLLAQLLLGTRRWLLVAVAILVGISLLELSPRWQERTSQLWFLALALQIGLWGTRAIAFLALRQEGSAPGEKRRGSASTTLISWALRSVLWATVLLAVLSNLGVNITAFVASLGVGGIAVALAAQNILADIFASLSIAIDKPFEVGDFIIVGNIVGTVQHIGLKTTRIRALSGEQIVIANTDLLRQTINNYRRMEERRIVFSFGLELETPPDKAEAVSRAVRDIISAEAVVRFDRAHLKGFGSSSLDYEVVYIVKSADYGVYMDVQQRINLALMRALEQLDVRLAVPESQVRLSKFYPATLPIPPVAEG